MTFTGYRDRDGREYEQESKLDPKPNYIPRTSTKLQYIWTEKDPILQLLKDYPNKY